MVIATTQLAPLYQLTLEYYTVTVPCWIVTIVGTEGRDYEFCDHVTEALVESLSSGELSFKVTNIVVRHCSSVGGSENSVIF